ncbi:Nitric oxide synthase brain, partial [Bienertia sinuspersici]
MTSLFFQRVEALPRYDFCNIRRRYCILQSICRAPRFTMRKATTTKNKQGVVSSNYCLCNKVGFKEKKKPTKDDSKRLVNGVGCKAKWFSNIERKEDVVSIFHEGHNNPLYTP